MLLSSKLTLSKPTRGLRIARQDGRLIVKRVLRKVPR